MTQPGVLFHGTPTEGVVVLMPAPSKVLEGQAAVFATDLMWIALIFAAKPPNNEIDFGFIDGRPYIAEMSAGAFSHLRRSGFVCVVNADGFCQERLVGMFGHEFVCRSLVYVRYCMPVSNPFDTIQAWFPRILLIHHEQYSDFFDAESFVASDVIQTQ